MRLGTYSWIVQGKNPVTVIILNLICDTAGPDSELTVSWWGGGRNQLSRLVRADGGFSSHQVYFGAATGIGADLWVLIEVQLTRVHDLPVEYNKWLWGQQDTTMSDGTVPSWGMFVNCTLTTENHMLLEYRLNEIQDHRGSQHIQPTGNHNNIINPDLSMVPLRRIARFQSFRVDFPAKHTNSFGLMSCSLN